MSSFPTCLHRHPRLFNVVARSCSREWSSLKNSARRVCDLALLSSLKASLTFTAPPPARATQPSTLHVATSLCLALTTSSQRPNWVGRVGGGGVCVSGHVCVRWVWGSGGVAQPRRRVVCVCVCVCSGWAARRGRSVCLWRVARREMGQWFSCAATAADVCVWRRACGNRSMRSVAAVAAVRRMHVGAEFPAGAGARTTRAGGEVVHGERIADGEETESVIE